MTDGKYLGGQWNPRDGFQPLERVSAYPEELTKPDHTLYEIDSRELPQILSYAIIATCGCGERFTAVSGSKAGAQRLIRTKHRKHIKNL